MAIGTLYGQLWYECTYIMNVLQVNCFLNIKQPYQRTLRSYLCIYFIRWKAKLWHEQAGATGLITRTFKKRARHKLFSQPLGQHTTTCIEVNRMCVTHVKYVAKDPLKTRFHKNPVSVPIRHRYIGYRYLYIKLDHCKRKLWRFPTFFAHSPLSVSDPRRPVKT